MQAGRVRFRWWLVLLMVVPGLLIVGLAVLAVFLIRIGQPPYVYIGLGIAAPIALGLAIPLSRAIRRQQRARKQAIEFVKCHPSLELPDHIVELMARGVWSAQFSWRHVLPLLAHRFAGMTVRIRGRRARPPFEPIDPISVPFEARHIDETASAFVALELSAGPAVESSASDEQHDPAALSEKRRVRGLVALGAGVTLLAMITLLVTFYGLAVSGLNAVVGAAVFLLAVAVPLAVESIRRDRWLFAPGCLIVRQRHGVKLFTRADTLLIVAPDRHGMWLLTAANRNGVESRSTTPTEAHVVLRAWLSSIPPPQRERLSDFA